MINKTLTLIGVLLLCFNAFSQSVLFSENFEETNPDWIFEYDYDTIDIYNDTAFAGTVDNKLVVMAYQAMGCPHAQAYIEMEDNFTWESNIYKLNFYLDSLMYGLATETYIEVTLKGKRINLPLQSILEINPKIVSFIQNDSVYIALDSASNLLITEENPLEYTIEDIDNQKFSMNVFSRGCGADLGHGAGIIIDSIKLIDKPVINQTTSTSSTKNIPLKANLFNILHQSNAYTLQFVDNSSMKLISVYTVDGKMIEKIYTSESTVEISKTNAVNSLLIVKVKQNNRYQIAKILK